MSNTASGEFPDGTHPELQKYILEKGWQFKAEVMRRRTELKVAPCPFCSNTSYNFEINAATGLYRCWACNASGSFESLQRELGDSKDGVATIERVMGQKRKENYRSFPAGKMDAPHAALMAGDMGALEYLRGRGFKDETIQHFRLGVVRAGRNPRLIIPHFQQSQIGLIMYRSMPPEEKVFIRETDMESIMFNQDALHESGDTIIVCEAQLDAMSVWQAGHENVVSVSTGAGTEFSNDYIDLLSGFKKIVMVYDGDDAGREGAKTIRNRLGADRVWIAECPEGEDVNSILVSEGDQGVERVIREAKPAPIPGIQQIDSVIEDIQEFVLSEGSMDIGYDWFLEHLTKCAGKAAPGDLIQIMGQPGVGKTTLALLQALYMAMVLGIPVLFDCLEMTPMKMVRKLIQGIFKLKKDEVNLEVISEALVKFEGIPLYFGFHGDDPNINSLAKTADQAFVRFGVRVWFVDNLIILTEGSSDPIREQATVTRKLKNWARARNNVTFLLTHPRKGDDGRVEGLSDMRGSGAITANADVVINLWRKNLAPRTENEVMGFNGNDFGLQDPKVAAFCLKGRDVDGSRVGWLFFDGARSFFRNCCDSDFDEQKSQYEGVGEVA
jgi:KaiC/GvpD/RAD55 family RecA-like ATPase